jgi:hypothetical protein
MRRGLIRDGCFFKQVGSPGKAVVTAIQDELHHLLLLRLPTGSTFLVNHHLLDLSLFGDWMPLGLFEGPRSTQTRTLHHLPSALALLQRHWS